MPSGVPSHCFSTSSLSLANTPVVSLPCQVAKQFRGSLRAAILVSFFVTPIRVKLVQFQDFSYSSVCPGVRNADPTLTAQPSLSGTIITMQAAVFLCTSLPIAMLLYQNLLRKWRFLFSAVNVTRMQQPVPVPGWCQCMSRT